MIRYTRTARDRDPHTAHVTVDEPAIAVTPFFGVLPPVLVRIKPAGRRPDRRD